MTLSWVGSPVLAPGISLVGSVVSVAAAPLCLHLTLFRDFSHLRLTRGADCFPSLAPPSPDFSLQWVMGCPGCICGSDNRQVSSPPWPSGFVSVCCPRNFVVPPAKNNEVSGSGCTWLGVTLDRPAGWVEPLLVKSLLVLMPKVCAIEFYSNFLLGHVSRILVGVQLHQMDFVI